MGSPDILLRLFHKRFHLCTVALRPVHQKPSSTWRERERERETHKEEEEKDYLGQQREMEEEKEGGMFQNNKIKKKEIWKGEKEKIKSEN